MSLSRRQFLAGALALPVAAVVPVGKPLEYARVGAVRGVVEFSGREFDLEQFAALNKGASLDASGVRAFLPNSHWDALMKRRS